MNLCDSREQVSDNAREEVKRFCQTEMYCQRRVDKAMLRHQESEEHKWIYPLVVGAATIALALLLFSRPSEPARQVVTWAPTAVERTLFAGQSATIRLQFKTTRKLRNVVVDVAPELQPFVTVEPAAIGDLAQDATVSVELIIAIPLGETFSQVVSDTIQLRSLRRRNLSKPYPAVLPIEIDVNPSTITEPTFGVIVPVPSQFSAKFGEDRIALFSSVSPPNTPRFVVKIVDVPWATDSLTHEGMLELIARTKLGNDFFDIVGFHDGGIEVRALTFYGNHFFLYNSVTQRAVEIIGSAADLDSAEFSTIVEDIEF